MKRKNKSESAEDIIYKIKGFLDSYNDKKLPGVLMPIKAWVDGYYDSLPLLPKCVINQHAKDCNERMKEIVKKKGINIKL